MRGYIKDFRKELGSDIWLMPPMYHRVWQFLKYSVNHENNKIPMNDGSFFNIKKGQRLTSVRKIAEGVGYYEGLSWKEPNPKTISKILQWLENQDMITIERGRGNRQYTLITLLNWDLYQLKDGEGNTKETPRGEGGEQLVDINKNEEECSKNEEEYIHDLFNHYISKEIIKHQEINESMKKAIKARLKDYDFEQLKQAIDNYATVLKNDDYYYTHKFPLADLMSDKNIRKFLDEADPLNNFLDKKKEKPKRQPDSRDKEIALQQWISEGYDPEKFIWE